ncbi:TetR/AcrR family transcriptional regulator [Actinacidiphila acididurans]|uniref:TetR family transcriptional regulator n=1 Tax=Actinacidiphila acididurans TaxID=2784346 RepID=A0ABS2TX68_9ACTN|nr:TetR family transcriptional regulator [Actinacidiphila acididurans]MBM9507945.1 TetR family transcriptional regulator [Actinacidiphila acididurans]
MTTFQRARSEEQREIRRRVILDTAAAMLDEMPVGEVSLNELSRRVGLAKSNVLRYFESREAILLELLDQAWQEWTAGLAGPLAAGVDAQAPVGERAEQFAAAVTASLADRRVLCDLLSAQAGVLEHNVSPEVAARYKRAAVANVAELAALTRVHLPELGDAAGSLAASAIMVIGAVWTHARPSQAMLAAYAADPSLAVLRMDFAASLRQMLATLTAGTLARTAAS